MNSGVFDRIIVSTDDDEIADTASRLGAEVPFRRPSELADDTTTTADVIADAIRWFQDNGERPEECCCIYPTAAALLPEDLRQAKDILERTGRQYVFAATQYRHPIQRALYRTAQGHIRMFHPEHANTRTQDLQPAFHDAGMFYFGRTHAWLTGIPIFSEESEPLILPPERALDIDSEQDWRLAELVFAARQVLRGGQ